ncbi:MAG: T9SS type A sorting domain-containing protein, partial [Flavobacteriales bacterium]|nr:T9SS type A sorting domain-containing protein [Flavobacteriales bacterium]
VWTYLLTSAVTVSAVEEKDPRQLGVRPNPARDRVRIQRAAAQGAATLDVLDATGRLLRQLPFPGGALELELNDLPTGMLLVAVTDAQGRSVARLVVER